MSLSDYSSDDSLDEEPALGVEAIKSVARSARTGGPSSMNTSNKSLVKAPSFQAKNAQKQKAAAPHDT